MARRDECRRKFESKSNHLHKRRRRCFYLAIIIHSSSQTLTDTQAEIVSRGIQAHFTRCCVALRLLLHVYGYAVDVQPICYTAVPERIAH